MKRLVNVAVPLSETDDLVGVAARELGVDRAALRRVDLVRRSIDARKKRPRWVVTLDVHELGDPLPDITYRTDFEPPHVAHGRENERILIVGSGPAGLFAALRCADAGIQCTVLERGGAIEDRNKRARLLRAERFLDPESNLCYGEGGAGTYSDGKLYTRKKNKRVREVYERLVAFGADPEILVDAHPHVGTNRLIPLVKRLRKHLVDRGIEFRFDTRLDDLIVEDDAVVGVVTSNGELRCDRLLLATGHSARDTYFMLARHGVALESKPFAIGARVEHPQELIDRIQFGSAAGHPALGAAEYFLRCQVGERGVYSFCMCPGGFIIPTPTEPGHLNVNGMSNQSRRNHFANAALVVTLGPEDFAKDGDALSGLTFQRSIERAAFEAGGQNYSAPATRLTDFALGRASTTLPARTSYRPGLAASNISDVLPAMVTEAIREALQGFERRMRGYLTEEAVIVAAETTTSSPIRITRDEMMQSVSLDRLYPTGEGAGYAGGIVSSALDGMRVMEHVLAE